MPEARVEFARGCPRRILRLPLHPERPPPSGTIAKHRNDFQRCSYRAGVRAEWPRQGRRFATLGRLANALGVNAAILIDHAPRRKSG